LIAAFLSAARAVAYSDQPPAKRTGAPGENTCAACHNGGLNDGQGALSILNVPDSYVPGSTYNISVTLARAGQTRWGFELTCLLASTSAAAGTITSTSALTGTQVSSGKTYVSQAAGTAPNDGTFAGTADGPVTWSFQWTAPAAGAGSVRFYAAGVAADNSGDADTGDYVYTTSMPSNEGAVIDVTEMTWGRIKETYRTQMP
jgi:hypothetical protein